MSLFEGLTEAPLLRGLNDDQRQALAEVATVFTYSAGERLFGLGAQARHILVVRQGAIQLLMPLQVMGVERQVVTEELSVGDTVGWSALVPPHSTTVAARATVASELVGFDQAELLALFEARPDIGSQVRGNLAGVVGRRLRLTQAMWLRELQNSVSAKYG